MIVLIQWSMSITSQKLQKEAAKEKREDWTGEAWCLQPREGCWEALALQSREGRAWGRPWVWAWGGLGRGCGPGRAGAVGGEAGEPMGDEERGRQSLMF